MLYSYRGIMYNLTSFIAIIQQAIKKPLVTELLPRSSYARGRRCERNYVQFLYIGQVTFNNCSIVTKTQDGDRRWFLSKLILIHNLIVRLIVQGCKLSNFALFSFVGFASLTKDYFQALTSGVINKESQVLVVPDFQKILSVTA